MNVLKIKILPRATQETASLFDYISADDIDAAHLMVEKIRARINLFKTMPTLGVAVPRSSPAAFFNIHRVLSVNPYKVHFFCKGDFIYISHVIHAKRDLARALFELEDTLDDEKND